MDGLPLPRLGARAFVDHVSAGGRARRKLAIVALGRRVLVICWGMLKTNTPFRAPRARTEVAIG